ncbi:MAG: AGE family epimerase/isomerase [Oleiphilus sp.]
MTSLNKAMGIMLDELINDCQDFVFKKLLKNWLSHGIDPELGYSYESLNHDWSPNPVGRVRLLTQCRQLYTFSHAYLETNDAQWRAPLDKLFEFILSHYWHQEAWAFSLHDDLTLQDTRSDSYALAFVLLAFSYYFKASGDSRALQYLEKTHHFLSTQMACKNGGFLESFPETPDSLRRQNPHMHLLEGYLAAFNVSQKPAYKAEIKKLLELLSKHFYHQASHSLLEYFTEDWLPDTESGHIIEPGHHFEWIWLLFQASKLFPEENYLLIAESLWAKACHFGFDPNGGIYNEIHAVSGAVINAEKRIWPITEYLKALCTLKAGASATKADLISALRFMRSHYLKDDGTWHEYLDQNNLPKPHPLPGTTSYHLFLGLNEVAQWAKTQT